MAETITVATTRFGEVEIDTETVFEFPQGLLGLEHLRRWCLLHHEEVEHFDWLQALEDRDVAVLLVNPDDLFRDYEVRLESQDIDPLLLSDEQAYSGAPPVVMRVVIRPEDDTRNFVVNVRAPLLFNLDNRKGMQIALGDDALPAHYRGPVALAPVPAETAAE